VSGHRFDVIEGRWFTAFRRASDEHWAVEGPDQSTAGWGSYHNKHAAQDGVRVLDQAYEAALPDTLVEALDRLERRARWKAEAGHRLWRFSGYGQQNPQLGDHALWMSHEAAALARAARAVRTGTTERVRRQYRNYDL
jgi:hypothetical protein